MQNVKDAVKGAHCNSRSSSVGKNLRVDKGCKETKQNNP